VPNYEFICSWILSKIAEIAVSKTLLQVQGNMVPLDRVLEPMHACDVDASWDATWRAISPRTLLKIFLHNDGMVKPEANHKGWNNLWRQVKEAGCFDLIYPSFLSVLSYWSVLCFSTVFFCILK
jgi:hypothetical protein